MTDLVANLADAPSAGGLLRQPWPHTAQAARLVIVMACQPRPPRATDHRWRSRGCAIYPPRVGRVPQGDQSRPGRDLTPACPRITRRLSEGGST
jgi:hypothetical protein